MKLRELRELVKAIVIEAYEDNGPETIPARHSPAEKELAAKFPTWGSPQARQSMQQQNPAQVKAKQVKGVLQQRGLDNTPAGAKVINQQLAPFLDNFDPQELFVLGPEDLADEFQQKFNLS